MRQTPTYTAEFLAVDDMVEALKEAVLVMVSTGYDLPVVYTLRLDTVWLMLLAPQQNEEILDAIQFIDAFIGTRTREVAILVRTSDEQNRRFATIAYRNENKYQVHNALIERRELSEWKTALWEDPR